VHGVRLSIELFTISTNSCAPKATPRPASAVFASSTEPLMPCMAELTVWLAFAMSPCRRATLAAISNIRVPTTVAMVTSRLSFAPVALAQALECRALEVLDHHRLGADRVVRLPLIQLARAGRAQELGDAYAPSLGEVEVEPAPRTAP
jgi:hypothetical protein